MPRSSARKLSVKMTLDFALFRRQKRDLIALQARFGISKQYKETLEGVINLLDHIQDAAARQWGKEEVFGKA